MTPLTEREYMRKSKLAEKRHLSIKDLSLIIPYHVVVILLFLNWAFDLFNIHIRI